MENANKRFAKVLCTKSSRSGCMTFEAKAFLVVLSKEPKLVMIELVGRQTDVEAIASALRSGEVVTLVWPNSKTQTIGFWGERRVKAANFGLVQIETITTPLQMQELLGAKEVFRHTRQTRYVKKMLWRNLVPELIEPADKANKAQTNSEGVIIFSKNPLEMVHDISERFCVPTLPSWSGAILAALKEQNLVKGCKSLGIPAVQVAATREQIKTTITNLMKKGVCGFDDNLPSELQSWNPRPFEARRKEWVETEIKKANSRFYYLRNSSVDELVYQVLIQNSMSLDQILDRFATEDWGQASVFEQSQNEIVLNQKENKGTLVGRYNTPFGQEIKVQLVFNAQRQETLLQITTDQSENSENSENSDLSRFKLPLLSNEPIKLEAPIFANLEDYLIQNGSELAERLTRIPPLATAETPDHPSLNRLLRQPLPKQKILIHAFLSLLKKEKYGVNGSQQGTGKSLQSLAALWLDWIDRGQPNGEPGWIICPPHAVSKWIKEIFKTLPNEEVAVFKVGRMVNRKKNRKGEIQTEENWGVQEYRYNSETTQLVKVNQFSVTELDSIEELKKKTTGPANKPRMAFFVGSRETLKLTGLKVPSQEVAGKFGPIPRYEFTNEGWTNRRTFPMAFEIQIKSPGQRNFWTPKPVTSNSNSYRITAKLKNGNVVENVWELYQATDQWEVATDCSPGPIASGQGATSDIAIKNAFQKLDLEVVFQSVPGVKRVNHLKEKLADLLDRKLVKKYTPSVITGKKYLPPEGSTTHPCLRFEKKKGDKEVHILEPLWQYSPELHRYSPLSYLLRKIKKGWRFLICDESHEYNGTSNQSEMIGTLMEKVEKVLLLSGTLSNGSASSLYQMFWRIAPQRMKALGFGYDSPKGPANFVEKYGSFVYVSKFDPKNKKWVGLARKESPGLMPWIMTDNLTGNGPMAAWTAFVDTHEMGGMPPFSEKLVLVEPGEYLLKSFREIETSVTSLIKGQAQSAEVKQNLGKLINALIVYLDAPNDQKPIIDDFGNVLLNPPNLDKNFRRFFPKEVIWMHYVKKELAENRRVITCVHYVNKGVKERLMRLLDHEGIKWAFLDDKVKPDDRMAWFEECKNQGVQVVICNPKKIQTAVDLEGWPTFLFYQSGTEITVNLQTECRSHRIGFKEEVRVFYFAYARTLQETALMILGRRKLALLALQGRFSTSGLAEMVDDVTNELARSLVQKGVVSDAEEIWTKIHKARLEVSETKTPTLDESKLPETTTEAISETEPPALDESEQTETATFELFQLNISNQNKKGRGRRGPKKPKYSPFQLQLTF